MLFEGAHGELPEQGGLAAARAARDEHKATFPFQSFVQQAVQRRQFLRASDKKRRVCVGGRMERFLAGVAGCCACRVV